MISKQKSNSRDRLTPEVAAMGQISFTGNVVPPIWNKQILNGNGKPNQVAITILADTVYWYRPAEKRHENGQFSHLEKKFDGDYLKRSYHDLEQNYGFTKKQSRTALELLEKLDLLHRTFQQVGNQPQTMFLRPVPSRIALLNKGSLLPQSNDRRYLEGTTVVTSKSQRSLLSGNDITENTTETYSSTTSEKISEADVAEFDAMQTGEAPTPSSAAPPSPTAPETALTQGELEFAEMELSYRQKVGMNAKLLPNEVSALMVAYFTKTDEGKKYFADAVAAAGAKEGEEVEPSAIAFPMCSKATQFELQDWRSRLMLIKTYSFIQTELSGIRRRAQIASRTARKSPATVKPIKDNPAEFDYSQNVGFDGN